MKKIGKLLILIICILSIIFFLTPRAVGDTKIGNSIVPVEEGDFYKWKMTYCHPNYSSIWGVGSYINLTVETIEQGPYGPVAEALLISVTFGEYIKGLNIQYSVYLANWIIYNASLHYLYIQDYIFIVPIPLNLTLVAEAWGEPMYTIDGNVFTTNPGSGFDVVYKFNSDGFVTNYIRYYEGEKLYEYTLGGGGEEEIPFGNYYLLISIIAVISIILIMKKRLTLVKKL
ncbi:MAG: hypothetical protein ACFFA6_09525 [Promethearchaeota archaeon]